MTRDKQIAALFAQLDSEGQQLLWYRVLGFHFDAILRGEPRLPLAEWWGYLDNVSAEQRSELLGRIEAELKH